MKDKEQVGIERPTQETLEAATTAWNMVVKDKVYEPNTFPKDIANDLVHNRLPDQGDDPTFKEVQDEFNKLLHPNVASIPEEEYSESGVKYSSGIITIWLIVGLAYNLITGHLISLSSLLLILPGTFIVSLGAIPFFLLHIKKKQVLQAQELNEGAMLMLSGRRLAPWQQIPTLVLFTLTTIAEWLYPAVVALVFCVPNKALVTLLLCGGSNVLVVWGMYGSLR